MGVFLPIMPKKFILSRSQIAPSEDITTNLVTAVRSCYSCYWIHSIYYVRAYIVDLLIITRGKLDDYISKLDTLLIRMHDTGLKVNAAKSFLCTHEIEYLGYILTREGIKPQPKKRYR